MGEVVEGWGRKDTGKGVGPEVWTQEQERRGEEAVSEGRFRTIGESF